MEKYYKEIQTLANINDIFLTENELIKLAKYSELLVAKNSIINLVSRKDIENVVENHILHSLLILKYLPKTKYSYLDIGTGGGLPGIPFAITYTESNGLLADSINKKINSVNEFISALELKNVRGICTRVEDKIFIEQYKNSFDLLVNRATAPLSDLLKYFIPLAKQNATLAILKGGDLTEEINQANLKYKLYIRTLKIFDLAYKPTNIENGKEKKLILAEISK